MFHCLRQMGIAEVFHCAAAHVKLEDLPGVAPLCLPALRYLQNGDVLSSCVHISIGAAAEVHLTELLAVLDPQRVLLPHIASRIEGCEWDTHAAQTVH